MSWRDSIDDDEEWRDDPDAWKEGLDDDDEYSEDDFDEEPTVPCPYCRREILEESVQCPHCREYISREDAPPAPKPWWMVVGVLSCLFVVLTLIFGCLAR